MQSKAKAKVRQTGHAPGRDHGEGTTQARELLHQCIVCSLAIQANQIRLSHMQAAKATFTPSLSRHFRSKRRAVLKMLRRWTQRCAIYSERPMKQALIISHLATVTTGLVVNCLTREGRTTQHALQDRIWPRMSRWLEAVEVSA